jgi:hypothetical protein
MSVSTFLYVMAMVPVVLSFVPTWSFPLEKVALFLTILGLLVPVFVK